MHASHRMQSLSLMTRGSALHLSLRSRASMRASRPRAAPAGAGWLLMSALDTGCSLALDGAVTDPAL